MVENHAKFLLKCVTCGTLMKKPSQDATPVMGLVCDNKDCQRFGLISVVAKKEPASQIITPDS